MQPLLERNPGADQQHTTVLQHSSQQEINTLAIIKKKKIFTNWRDSKSTPSSLKTQEALKVSILRKIKHSPLYLLRLYASNAMWPQHGLQQHLRAPKNDAPCSALERAHAAPTEANGSCFGTAEGRIQPSALLIIRDMKEARWKLSVQSVEITQEKVPPPERLPNKNENYRTHSLVILTVFLQKNIKRKLQCPCSSYSRSVTHNAALYMLTHTHMYT